jgi:hypothetical protein
LSYHPDEDATRRRISEMRARWEKPEFAARNAARRAPQMTEKRGKKSSKDRHRKTPENSTTFFGHSWPLWHRMRDAGIVHIAACAKESRTTTYAELWSAIQKQVSEDIGRPFRQIRALAGTIANHAHDTHEPMLTALVVHEGDGHPGPGFFRLAAQRGLLPEADFPSEEEEWTAITPNQQAFWESQVNAVFAQFAE